MTDVEHFAEGQPCWIDLATPDPHAAGHFYYDLFGWSVKDTDAQGFSTFTLHDRKVAGLGPRDAGSQASWNMYITTYALEAAVADVLEFGGKVLVEPTDVGDEGRGAACSDPTGAVFSLWQPGTHKGIGMIHVNGTWFWSELLTTDATTAAQFYANVFDWTVDIQEVGGADYAVAQLGETRVASIAVPPTSANIAPTWTVTFMVSDVDRIAKDAARLGGRVAIPPTDVPGIGRFAALGGPTGEAFSVVAG